MGREWVCTTRARTFRRILDAFRVVWLREWLSFFVPVPSSRQGCGLLRDAVMSVFFYGN